MTRLVRPHELLLLAAGACVPLSIALTPWPPATHETTVIRELVPVACDESASVETVEIVEPVEPEPVEPEPVEPESAEPESAEPESAEPDPGIDFMWLRRPSVNTGAMVVLATEPQEAWAAGQPEALEADGIVTRRVEAATLPPAMRDLVGRRLDLYSSRGRVCTAEVGSPRLVAEATGELDMLLYDGPDRDDVYYWALPERERRVAAAPSIWEHGRQLLVAPLATPPECGHLGDLLWARVHDSREVRPLEPSAGGRPRSALAGSFLTHPELVELGEALAREPSLADDGADESAPPRLRDYLTARRWRADAAAAVVTVATVGDPFSFEECGFDFPPKWGIASFDANGKPGPVHLGPWGEVVGVLDLEDDGIFEVIVEEPLRGARSLLTLTPSGLEPRAALEAIPYYGCPC